MPQLLLENGMCRTNREGRLEIKATQLLQLTVKLSFLLLTNGQAVVYVVRQLLKTLTRCPLDLSTFVVLFAVVLECLSWNSMHYARGVGRYSVVMHVTQTQRDSEATLRSSASKR